MRLGVFRPSRSTSEVKVNMPSDSPIATMTAIRISWPKTALERLRAASEPAIDTPLTLHVMYYA